MRKLILSLLLGMLWIGGAHAACTTQSNVGLTTALSKAITVAANGDTVIIIPAENTSTSPTSVTATSGTPASAVAWEGSTSGGTAYTGVWYIANASAGSNTITVNNPSSVATTLLLFDCSGLDAVAPFDAAATLSNSGGVASSAVTTNAATPISSGELAIAWWAAPSATGRTSTTWTNSFTQAVSAGPSSSFSEAAATLVLGAPSSTSTGTTLSATANWVAVLAFFKASSGSSCTHAGWTNGRAFAVPTAGSTLVWLQTLTFGTTPCDGTGAKYWQSGRVFGAN